ncbi:hypothetical protein K504DRAFT_135755 [Pleomassaria siparia CBS 279.74]|uniref:Uncharacterized protein n=1 Tax=Pleomassaria siparia CBS 279.74 TaxID=1314801 RepID=A0A6G1KKJ1_9PLEO|nr:hypothetical protein K504DRAFT_135755 [Pleomassaria siparia CBS 279.74]
MLPLYLNPRNYIISLLCSFLFCILHFAFRIFHLPSSISHLPSPITHHPSPISHLPCDALQRHACTRVLPAVLLLLCVPSSIVTVRPCRSIGILPT